MGLKQLGFYSGSIDGIYGKRTKTSILAFQTEQGLPQTGTPSEFLREEIEKVVQER